MKYLGIYYKKQYYRDTSVEHYASKAFGYKPFDTEVLMKEAIRKHVLPTYQPTKTLEWLEEQTGVKWGYNSEYCALEVDNHAYGMDDAYTVRNNETFVNKEGKLLLVVGYEYDDLEFVKMTPREFIEKIAKGEWV